MSNSNSRHAVRTRASEARESSYAVVQWIGEREFNVLGWYFSKGGAEMAAEVARERQERPEATTLPMRGVVVVWDEVRVKTAELALVLAQPVSSPYAVFKG